MNQGYCYFRLQEQGSRSFSTVGKHRPSKLEEFIILQEYIFDRIKNLDKKEDIKNLVSVMDIEMGNYPNPFNPETMINFNLAVSGEVNLEIFNIRDQKVRVLMDELMPAGSHEILWNGRNEYGLEVASGVYFYRLQTENETFIRRMMLIK
ncbi:MAG: T9SS type A sorting domain-containing protein [Candidatus Cloacimonetes bacterium]|nr:T9SS type A sorting domain-containing protein [Candidatus Cloacimonadota bacterium]